MNTATIKSLSDFYARTASSLVPKALKKDEDGFTTHFGGNTETARVHLAELARSANSATGAGLIPTGQVQSASAPLGKQSFLADLGAVFVGSDMQGESELPQLLTDPVAAWIPEEFDGEDVAASQDPEISKRYLAPHTVRSHVVLSRRLSRLSMQVQGTISAALLRSMRAAIQSAAISGAGANNEPQGLLNVTGMGYINASGSFTAPVFHDAIEDLELAGADPKFIGVIAHPTTKKKLSAVTFNNGVFWRSNVDSPTKQTAGDLPSASSIDVPEGSLIIGDFSQLLIVHNNEVDMTSVVNGPDFGPKGRKGIFAFLEADVAVRNPNAFVVVQNV